ncbi:MAG: D-alanyl-D-alanine carboxypeptidase/D-alanyl-D-alanine-endopeptidase [Rhizonema sp. PD38]|nr:D-alanyl-D-alanine carboxypeptidase/D-alanyl-D-alanine-endopeptidase [Rhizonema sp. PD38]
MSKRISIGLLLLSLGAQGSIILKPIQAQTQVAPTAATKSICLSKLPIAINTITNRPQFNRMRWGISVQPLLSPQNIYSLDAQKYFTPASNAKLLTTAAALQQLGANFRFRTSVYLSGNDLHVVGRGDPSLSDLQLIALAKQLSQKGIRQINQLIVDDSYIRGEIVNPSWQWEDIESDYGAPINSLILNQNVFNLKLQPQTIGKPLQVVWIDIHEAKQWQVINESVTTREDISKSINITRDLSKPILRIQGQLTEKSNPEIISLPVSAPAEYFLRHFRNALAAEKITVAQAFVSVYRGKNEQEIAAVESPPLSQLLAETNINSNNLFAEVWLRSLAVKKLPTDPNQSSADAGLEVMKATLTQLGVDPKTYVLVDGSGLSRKDLVTPEAFVQILRAMRRSPQAEVYLASLPVAGISGTLKNRFLHTPAEGIVHAKTGTMDGVVSLSGYVNAPQYGPIVFSIIVNQTEQPIAVVRQAVDKIVVLLAQLQRC